MIKQYVFKCISEYIADNPTLSKLLHDVQISHGGIVECADRLDALSTQVQTLQSDIATIRTDPLKAQREGTDPWVAVLSSAVDPTRGLQIELDWNDAFVAYLRQNGLTGKDDRTVIHKWLSQLSQEMSSTLEDNVIGDDSERDTFR